MAVDLYEEEKLLDLKVFQTKLKGSGVWRLTE